MMFWKYWDWSDWLLWSAIVGVGLLMVVLVAAMVHGAREWEAYRVAHACKRTGESETYTTLMPISTGKTTVLMPQTHTSYEWQCRGGEVIWR